ncbi:enoyl-CoA hydratase [Hydromonas duriensis]|uniref:Enoyl-CoA hydratase/carnithine racemase n=1 Tax=Hydromonas duriensis TaxID=1527608 RepID=A0A4R6YAM1_9BURK|nr:enoyl-CoA hydratase [Hydromonas duriensis]TDR32554.1 enoyl-CoA hydratase/carnithine racemase [Hydromonas duriensis]
MSILSHIDDAHVGHIQISRAERKNALTARMYDAMVTILREYDADDNVRVILLYGLPEMFCAGNDLSDFLENPINDANSPVIQFLYTLRDLQKPLVMCVNGVAVGIGATMLLHADFVVAAEDSKFQLPFINLALCPEGGSSLLLPQRAGYLRAAEKLMFGEFFSTKDAFDMQMVTHILPHHETLRYAVHQAHRLAEKSPSAMRETKRLLKTANANALHQCLDAEISSFAQLLKGNDAREAMTAFLEKRKPNF